ncbi:MAG: hypothetical protein EOP85_01650 [Verrucomicrobiaceae bacterium]|nr:MAG: hypothetical protein EOP85_01650 [Verrucomicrobiaceae bacterium]
MRTLLPAIVIACGALLPVATVHAAPASQLGEFAAKKFGGFKAGYKFKLKVTDVTVVSTLAKAPKGVPVFKKGSKIPFKIGKKGELTAPKKVKIPFDSTTATINEYLKRGSDPKKLTSTARITKDSKGKASLGSMTFVILAGSPIPTPYQVTYTLGK